MSRLAIIVSAVVTVTALALPASAAAPARIGGPERVATAAQIADVAFPGGASAAVIARSDDFPDALAASALAGAVDGPVLLTHPTRLSPQTAATLRRLAPGRVYLLGGATAVSDAVARTLGANVDVVRIAGADRYETAADVAREAVRVRGGIGVSAGRTTVLIASGQNAADAVTSSSTAFAGGHPILLVTQRTLPAPTRQALRDLAPEGAVLLGGTATISATVEAQIRDLGIAVTRVGGATRFDTAERFAEFSVERFDQSDDQVVLTRGDLYPDALAGGPLAGKASAPILLTQSPTSLGGPAERYLSANCADIDTVRALGGRAAISEAVLARATAAATCD
ncbi:MAG: cell wall-binding repeat-containing protein [Egibacteraceae bacterium]